MKTVYGAAGNLSQAGRTVRKDGSILFDGNVFQDKQLIAYVGERVEVFDDGHSAFSNGPIIIKNERGREICRVESDYEKAKHLKNKL